MVITTYLISYIILNAILKAMKAIKIYSIPDHIIHFFFLLKKILKKETNRPTKKQQNKTKQSEYQLSP